MDLLTSLWNVIASLAGLLMALVSLIAPWTPLLAWIAFWLLAVNWRKLYPVLMKGGLIGVVLIAFLAVGVWATVSIPPEGVHHFYGLRVSNVVGKTVYVTALVVIAMLCGSVQLSGVCDRLCRFEEPQSAPDSSSHH